jgi:hypothetical protein
MALKTAVGCDNGINCEIMTVVVIALLITSDGKMIAELDKDVEETYSNLPGQSAMSQLRRKLAFSRSALHPSR